MPDLINPILDTKVDTPDIPVHINTTWNRPTVQIPEILKQTQSAFEGVDSISLPDFNNMINNGLSAEQIKRQKEDDELMTSLTPRITPAGKETSFRFFNSADRYKQNDRLWKTEGFNPEIPQDITDAIYDFHETKWESIKNVFPKLWSTTSFAFKNYFAEYYDTARAIGHLDANMLHDAKRFDIYQQEQEELENLNPDYRTDKEVRWWQLGRGDFWEQSGSSLGFTIGTIGAALAENVAITLATGGLGEIAELVNTPRKIFKAISDYYSLRRAFSLVKGAIGARTIIGKLSNGVNLWRLANGAVSEAAFEGATNSYQFLQGYRQKFINDNGREPTAEEMKHAKSAANSMANATILFETPFLMLSNAVQFGNLIAPNTVAKLATKFGKKGAFEVGLEGLSAAVKPTEDALKGFSKYAMIGANALKNPLMEGTEESYQALVTTSTQAYYGDKYLKGKDSNILDSLGAGFDYLGSNQGMIEFSAGFATGAIFKVAGKPFHWLAKPTIRTEEEQSKFKAANPGASDLDAKYKTNFLNKFGFGVDKINKEREKANLEKIAKSLNQVDLDKFLKEEGFLSLLKDKQTQFALAKYLETNDQFNMQNVQNLQLNRYLYAGLENGKIDLQIDKLRAFASQDFSTLKDWFNLDDNDYQTQAEKDQFVGNLRSWVSTLSGKAAEMEKIYDKQKGSFGKILNEVAKDHATNLTKQNAYLINMKAKYNVDNTDDLDNKMTDEEKSNFLDLAEASVASNFRYSAVNEGIKASVFAQVGMNDAAKRAKDVVNQLIDNDSVRAFYNELGDFFDIGYRERRLQDLLGKVNSAKATDDPNLGLYENQLSSFNKMKERLDNQFNEAKNYNVNVVAEAIQEYLYNMQREVNRLDNSTDLETRMKNEMEDQFGRLVDFTKLQRQHQENLNLYNYLSATANKEDYINFQSRKLTDFFSKVAELAEEKKQTVTTPTTPTTPTPAAPVTPVTPTPAASTVATPAVQPTPAPTPAPAPTGLLTEDEQKAVVKNLIFAIRDKDYQKVNDLKDQVATFDKDLVMKIVNALTKQKAFAAAKDEILDLFNEMFEIAPSPSVTPTEPEDEITTKVKDFIARGIIKGADLLMANSDPKAFIEYVAQQSNNVVGGKFDETNDARQSSSVIGWPQELKDYANETFPEYKKIADEYDNRQPEPNFPPAADPVPIEEVPPTTPESGTFIQSVTGPLNTNPIMMLVDKAREDGDFVFDAINPKEIEEGDKKVTEDNKLLLRTASDPMLLKHHMIMEKLEAILSSDNKDDINNFKIKLELLSDDNKDFFYKRDAKSNSVIAMIVDKNGKYHYFDDLGNVVKEENGTPFGVEYEDSFYNSDKLALSRDSLANKGIGTTITPEASMVKVGAPLMTIFTLLHNKVPVYGSILGITSGRLSTFNVNNTFNTKMQDNYKTRTVKEMFEAGDIEEQYFDVRISGFYIEYSDTASDQRTKIGRPTLLDIETGLRIPLIGKKLKNVTFYGQDITKGSQLYEVIDTLDKTGTISADTLRPDKTRIIANDSDIPAMWNFLRELLYSKEFSFILSPNGRTINLKRNDESLRANSLWDAEINFVAKKDPRTSYVGVPFTSPVDEKGEPTETEISYFDFLNENFYTGAIKAIISKNDERFAKLNKRMVFKLDQSHKEMLSTISTNVHKAVKTKETPVAGDNYSPESDLTKVYTVQGVDEDRVTIRERGTEDDQTISIESLSKKWVKIEKIDKPDPVISTEQQRATLSSLKPLTDLGKQPKSTYTVTGLIRPLQVKSSSATDSLMLGNAIDHIAKNVFENNKLSPRDIIKIGNLSGELGSFFTSDLHYQNAVDIISKIKRKMEEDGYIFATGVRVRDSETGTGGEIDLVAIDPKGIATIVDFKTSKGNFDDNHLAQTYFGVSDKQYFATQGYIYGLLLKNQTGINVSDKSMIIGMPIGFTTGTAASDAKIDLIRKKPNYLLSFTNKDIADHYKGMTTIKEIVDKYNKIINENAVSEDDAEQRTGKKKRGGSLEMTVGAIQQRAATNEELKKEIDHLSEMFGEPFLATFVNSMNRYRYGEWTINGTILYKNAIAGTAYHEGWHQFSQLFLTPAEKTTLYESIRNQAIPYINRNGDERNTSDHDDLEVEEFLADEWVKYVQSPSSYKFPGKPRGIIQLFKNLWRLIKEFFNGTKNPTTLFKDLYNGNLKNYKKDVNNAIWGGLNASILDDNGNEIINHIRTNTYIRRTSYFVGRILKENNLSFSWLRENSKSEKMKDLIYDKYVDLQADTLAKLDVPEKGGLNMVLTDPQSVLENTVEKFNISPEKVANYISQIKEIENLLADENGAFNNFYDHYLHNTDIDTIRETDDSAPQYVSLFDSEDAIRIEEEYRTSEDEDDIPVDEESGIGSAGERYGEGPNDKSAFIKASKEVQDFFRTMPIVSSVDEKGNMKYMEDELGVPYTYDYASIFNKTKTLLAGQFTIEDIMERLANPHIRKTFPQAQYIMNELQDYMNKQTPENFSFIQKFIKIMALPEVDNKKLSINFDALNDKVAGREKTVIKVRSLSRTGEMADISQWEHNFTLPSEKKPISKITDALSLNDLFNSKSKENILYNIDGVLKLNPFFDYNLLQKGMGTKEFLGLMGIELNENFWSDPLSKLADRLKSLLLTDLIVYREYSEYLMAQAFDQTIDQLRETVNSSGANRELTDRIVDKFFLDNPLQQFRERKTYKKGDKLLESYSIYTAMEDVSRQNSLYSLEATSRSFSDGGGKLKWPFYEPSVIAYRTQVLNNIDNVRQFNENPELAALNPNSLPWLKNTLFYQQMFDAKGNRRTISGDVKSMSNDPVASEKVRIDIADLSSLETISNFRYNRFHPKSLNAMDKMFFDTITLLSDGWIEVPRAATSSSIFAVKLNSYGAKRQGTGFVSQFLPIDVTSSSVFRTEKFRVIMHNYLTGELQKLKWYNSMNSSHPLANKLNVFNDILSSDMRDKLIAAAKTTSNGDMKDLVKDNAEAINGDINTYFTKYMRELYNGNNKVNYMNMSPLQKRVLKNLLNLYQDRSKLTDKESVLREQQIGQLLEQTGQTSAFQSSKEAAFESIDASLQIIAAAFAANQFILNVEYHNWFMGDNYLFSNPFKRGNLTTNTGTMGVVSTFTNSMLNNLIGDSMHSIYTGNNKVKDFRFLKTMVLKDAIIESKYFDMMINDITNWEKAYNPSLDVDKRKTELKEGFEKYKEINAADGQAKIGLDNYRIMRMIYGNWSNADENEYNRQLAILRYRKNLYGDLKGDKLEEARSKDKKLMEQKVFSQFNPQKFAYTGPAVQKNDGPMQTKFDKMSLHPLLPEMLAGTGLPDERLMDEMAINDIDYAKFESASKGVKNPTVPFFDEQGNSVPNLKLEDYQSEDLLTSYLKWQLSTDGMKDENTFGSQQRVMFFDVKYQPEVQNNPQLLEQLTNLEKRYLASVNNIMEFQKSQFLNRFGMKEVIGAEGPEFNIEDNVRFSAAINSLAKRNNFPTNMIDYLKYDPAADAFFNDPSLIFNRKMLIDTIGGEIDGELRRLKTKGIAAIQVTQVGNASNKFTNPTDDQVREFGTAGLHYYHFKYDDKGKPIRTSTMGIKITLQGDFKNLLNLKWNGKVIGTLDRLNEALKDKAFKNQHMEKLTFVGYRIPTNNNNFIDHAEVMEFLPESAGNIIIAPLEHIIKSGSDFDVDKMNFIFPSINNKGELATQPTMSINDIYSAINKKTSSMKDYKKRQKEIKNLVKKEKKDFKTITKRRNQIELLLRNAYFNIDPNVYAGMQSSDKTFQEMTDYFKPFLDDASLYDLDSYEIASQILSETDKSPNKIDFEFESLLKDLNTYKDYHTNEMLKVMKETLSNPAYLKIMVSPSNADYLLSQAKRIGDLTGRTVNDNLSSSANTLYTTVNVKHKEYLTDSKDLGLYSIQRRWFSLLNFSRLELNRRWAYGAKGSPMIIYSPLASIDERDKIGTNDIVRVYGDNLDNISPKDLWDQFMTLTIDLPSNTSYTLFGINKHNRKVAQYLMISRYSVPKIMSFINQPILQDVYDLYEKRIKEYPDYMLKHAMLEIAKRYGISGVGFDTPGPEERESLYSAIFEKDPKTEIELGPNVFVKAPGIYAVHKLSDDIEFTQDQLDKDITRDPKNPDWKARQKNVLLYFMAASLEAANFSGMQFAFSEDRNKNTNYFTITENDRKKEAIRGDEENDLPVDNSMFSKEGLTRIEKHSIYSPFTYSKVAKLFYEKFAKEFTSPFVAGSIMRLLDTSNAFGIDRQILASRIEGDFIEFVYKNFASFNIDVYDPFTDTISPSTDKFGTYFIKRIFNVTKDTEFKSYRNKLTKFLERYPELTGITFVNKLRPEGISPKTTREDEVLNGMDTFAGEVIRFKRSQDNTVAERNHYANEFENLIAFNPTEFKIERKYSPEDIKKVSAFFTELAYLTLYQSGPTNIADNFSDLIPANLWKEFSEKAFENYHKNIKDGVIRPYDMMKMFNMMYTENNPKVSWKSENMVYDLKYYGENLTNKIDRKNAYQSRQNTEYFRNFRAGKMYDLQLFANKINFTGISEIKC